MDPLLIILTLVIVAFIAYILSRPFIEAKEAGSNNINPDDQESPDQTVSEKG